MKIPSDPLVKLKTYPLKDLRLNRFFFTKNVGCCLNQKNCILSRLQADVFKTGATEKNTLNFDSIKQS